MMKQFNLDAEIATETTDVTIWGYRYRTIGPDAVTEFLATLEPGEKAEILINSPGGSAMAGLAIANSIKNSKADITCHVIGMAASIASVIACAGHHVVMEEGSFLMIHDPWTYATGNADEMRKVADTLDVIKDGCMAFYRAKFPARSGEELAQLMSEETWYTGQMAKDAGLDCEVVPASVRVAACMAKGIAFAKIPNEAAQFLTIMQEPKEPQANCDWEARFKGASKKINELQNSIAANKLEYQQKISELQNTIAANAADYKDLQSQFDECKKELVAAKDSLKGSLAQYEQLRADADKVAENLKAKDGDLAQARDNLAKAVSEIRQLKESRSILAAGALSPATKEPGMHGLALIKSRII